MTKRNNCQACSFKRHGVKTRKSIPHTCETIEDDPLVQLYHGTAELLGDLIDERRVLKPKNRYVYLTTDIEVAKTYARAWSAWALEEVGKKDKRRKVNPVGAILKIKMRKSTLEDDPYNPEGEPNQYRVDGCVYLEEDEYEIEKIEFPELKEESKLMSAYCFWIGIGQANDD